MVVADDSPAVGGALDVDPTPCVVAVGSATASDSAGWAHAPTSNNTTTRDFIRTPASYRCQHSNR
jgi:hypothetical protein